MLIELLWLVMATLMFLGYFTPWLIAWARNHPQCWSIFALNLTLGWSFIGWAIALVWSLYRTESVADQAK